MESKPLETCCSSPSIRQVRSGDDLRFRPSTSESPKNCEISAI
ncbi:hypothetical protein CCACVL1_28517 [Corchorus capsularis]|uniref:Uncharacterized protein n=1 Tax=Corchorus capsularis TaxID=210143 RepID=A0A1R3G6C4_COCAP|nr:hypothetical protein CCACVL1_28517 [Corchorus capsularis]